MLGTPEVDDSERIMKDNSMIGNTSCSLAKECKRLCEFEIRINSVKLYREFKKREGNTKVKRKSYHLQDKDDVEMEGILK